MPNAKIFMLISTVKRIFCVGPQRWAFSQQIVNRKDKRGSEGHTHEGQLCCLHLELELRRAVLVPQRILCSHHHGVAARHLGRPTYVRNEARLAGQRCPVRLVGRGWPSRGAALGFVRRLGGPLGGRIGRTLLGGVSNLEREQEGAVRRHRHVRLGPLHQPCDERHASPCKCFPPGEYIPRLLRVCMYMPTGSLDQAWLLWSTPAYASRKGR